MTTFFHQSVTCANCRKPSEHQVLGSTNAFGSSDLDLRPPEMRRSTMRAWLQECPHCRYIASDISQPMGDLSLIARPEYGGLLNDQQFPDLARRFLAHAFLFDASDPATAGLSRLHAAWVCDDSGQLEPAAECRKLAAECFASLKPFEDSEPGVTQGAVLVDVLRRSGSFDQATSECGELLTFRSAQGLLRQVLEYQHRLIAECDSATHTVEEATSSA